MPQNKWSCTVDNIPYKNCHLKEDIQETYSTRFLIYARTMIFQFRPLPRSRVCGWSTGLAALVS